MDKKAKKSGYNKKDVKLTLFFEEGQDVDFLPWEKGNKGSQSFVKLTKNGNTALYYGGEENLMEAEIQRNLMKLSNDGWNKEGEVFLDFDGRSSQEKEVDELFKMDAIRLEIGRKLLPLVDPGMGSPLVDAVFQIRKEIVQETGFVAPGIRIADNMNIPFDSYVIYLKETPIASGEIYLDRFLIMGDMKQLSQLKGWSVKDPVYNTASLWVEPEEKTKAENLECLIMGPLNVLLTHLREALVTNLSELLGLQDVKHLLDKLKKTHPILVEGFINDRKKLKLIRKILRNLVAERVGIRDLVTIMETIVDYEDSLEKIDFVTEMVRISLARQICWTYLDPEGKIDALVLSRELEEKLQNSIKESKHGLRLVLSGQEADAIINELKKTLEDFKNPRVIFCDPPTRLYFRRLTESNFPGLGILSTAEISRRIRIEVLGEVELPEEVAPAKSPQKVKAEAEEKEESEKKEKDKKGGKLFGLLGS